MHACFTSNILTRGVSVFFLGSVINTVLNTPITLISAANRSFLNFTLILLGMRPAMGWSSFTTFASYSITPSLINLGLAYLQADTRRPTKMNMGRALFTNGFRKAQVSIFYEIQ